MKTFLITGAGGSIGSALARFLISANGQDCRYILNDQNEFSLFELQRDLGEEYGSAVCCNINAVLGDVRSSYTKQLLSASEIDVIFHVAAYKHVTLVQQNPLQAFANNIESTRSAIDIAKKTSAKLVMISTDKAVYPSTHMGVSKRFAEHMIASEVYGSPLNDFSFCRFGNVLGSSGSVFPIWEKQFALDVPLTVTDLAACRYFVSIEKAVAGIAEISALPPVDYNTIFSLPMGKPLNIYESALGFLLMRGKIGVKRTPQDRGEYQIDLIGLRPGEKLIEQLSYSDSEEPVSDYLVKFTERDYWIDFDLIGKVERRVYADELSMKDLEILGSLFNQTK